MASAFQQHQSDLCANLTVFRGCACETRARPVGPQSVGASPARDRFFTPTGGSGFAQSETPRRVSDRGASGVRHRRAPVGIDRQSVEAADTGNVTGGSGGVNRRTSHEAAMIVSWASTRSRCSSARSKRGSPSTRSTTSTNVGAPNVEAASISWLPLSVRLRKRLATPPSDGHCV